MNFSFRVFMEDEARSLTPDKKPAEDYLDAMHRELGIGSSDIPNKIESGPVELDGYYFNQAVWEVIKPIDPKDRFIRIKLASIDSPNIDQRVYRKNKDGSFTPYEGPLPHHAFLISKKQFSEMMSRGWQGAIQAAGAT